MSWENHAFKSKKQFDDVQSLNRSMKMNETQNNKQTQDNVDQETITPVQTFKCHIENTYHETDEAKVEQIY